MAVSHHRVLWSPDFPLPGRAATALGSDRPADLRTFALYNRRGGLKASRSLRIIRKRRRCASDVRAGAAKGRSGHGNPFRRLASNAGANLPRRRRRHRQLRRRSSRPRRPCRRFARTSGQLVHGPAVAITFDPRPIELLRPGQAGPPLTTTEERARLLHDLGVDHVLVLHTTHELLALRADDFFAQVVQQRLAVRAPGRGNQFSLRP